MIEYDLVFEVLHNDGSPLKILSIPLKDLPPNCNAAYPLMAKISIQAQKPKGEILLAQALPCWGNKYDTKETQ